MKVFISQPMREQTEEAILKARSEAVKKVKSMYGEDVEILNSFFDDFNTSNVKNPAIAYLAKSMSWKTLPQSGIQNIRKFPALGRLTGRNCLHISSIRSLSER